jgi:mono/diheme cytochrome c family protein
MRWVLAVIVVLALGAGIYLLKPVRGPERDLTLVGDVERGNYTIRLGGCIGCHTDTANGGAQFGGGAPLATPFGTFVAPNISSDPDVGIGNWTLAMFSDALSNGEGPQGHLYPTFPYDSFTLMSDQEVADLYAALMASEPVPLAAPPHQINFPFNIRLAMAGWKNLFFHPGRYEPDPNQSETWNRGRYLAIGPAHCIACHSPRNAVGAIEAGREFTGNPEGGTGGRAPAITREALIEDGYDQVTLVEALRSGFTPNFDVLGGPMGEVIRDSTSQWSDEDLAAIADYLLAE